VRSRVTLRDLSLRQIERYVGTHEPLDKAGAYAIQGEGRRIVESYDGCLANITGLPLCHVYFALRRVGVVPRERPEVVCQAHFAFVCPVWRTAQRQGRALRDGGEYRSWSDDAPAYSDRVADPISVLIVDDHLAVAESLQALLSRQTDLDVGEVATNGAAALRIAAERKPHVVLMDQNLSGESGVEVASKILAAHPGTAVVMLSGGMSQDELVAAVEAGVSGYLMKATPAAEIVKAIRRAAAGEILLPPDELASLLRLGRERTRQRDERQRNLPQLTRRESEVLVLMSSAADVERIAGELKISVNTARGYIQNILEKLGAHSRLEAVVRATELGLLGA